MVEIGLCHMNKAFMAYAILVIAVDYVPEYITKIDDPFNTIQTFSWIHYRILLFYDQLVL